MVCKTAHKCDNNNDNDNFLCKTGVPNDSRLINAKHFDTIVLTNKTQ